ncbi:MAG TPA: C40 family peptidase [Azoarcus taiwanensis]|nr:C40 family peptidase [Azoarcus taiwanensis]
MRSSQSSLIIVAATALVLTACSTAPKPASNARSLSAPTQPTLSQRDGGYFKLQDEKAAEEIVLYALGLLGTGYRFGGNNPEAGLDCSGMVRYIVQEVSGQTLPHNAAQIADMTRPISVAELRPGDLVFFNTLNRRHSHMGIYMGDGRFVHAPNSRSQIRIERLDNTYFRPRIDGARRIVASLN